MSPAVSQRLLMCQLLVSGEPALCSRCLNSLTRRGNEGLGEGVGTMLPREAPQALRSLFLTQTAPSWRRGAVAEQFPVSPRGTRGSRAR